ncbi:probable ATP-dependent RNA helicase Dbp73D [Uranotaenia lowii]|uniref:probable ATP-dependent RNA helicase Dbp73D n=1 Tax=Uranotaenia lowii TaxID=190385 RepID=UPI00247A84BF|nr:probable ATP-dependent RNA helicase Dbp73D [Uranotaenia lowii]
MDLFKVNRYDATKLSQDEEKLQEELILQRLLSSKKNTGKSIQHVEPEITERQPGQDENDDSEETTRKIDKKIEQTENVISDRLHETYESESKPENQTNFTTLGEDHIKRLKKVDEILPPWLSHPTIIDSDLNKRGKSIKKLDYIDDQLKTNLRNMHYKRLFPVQETVIPWILNVHRKPAPFWPRDLCISSPTGSGKTLAFAVPIVQMLLRRIFPAVRALVILPVKELAEQVFGVFEKLCDGTKVRPILLSRKHNFTIEQGKLVDKFNGEYMAKVDIVVTTAGRLVEHLNSTEGFTLKDLRFLIIDEADRVMDQIQNDWLYHLNKHVKAESDQYLLGRTVGQLSQSELFDKPKQPHKLLFSATLSQDPEKLQTFKLFHPKLFTAVADPIKRVDVYEKTQSQQTEEKRGAFAGQYSTPAELRQLICMTQYRIKPLTLFALIKENNYKRFLCFTNSIDASHRLSFVLQKMLGQELLVEEWSSSLSPAARKSVLNRFALGKVNGIICTDALARGIDIEDIDVVISYDMPRHINTYIHRIGRTGRAGNHGTSITMLIDEEKKKFNAMLAAAGKSELGTIDIKSNAEEEYAVLYSSALNDLREALDIEKQTINKIRNGMSIASMTKVNLLSKLKDRVDLDTNNSSETIKSLMFLPKAWTNEAIEQRANEDGARKRKRKKQAANLDPKNVQNTDKDIVSEGRKKLKLTSRKASRSGKRQNLKRLKGAQRNTGK